jgi:hypothetical protein
MRLTDDVPAPAATARPGAPRKAPAKPEAAPQGAMAAAFAHLRGGR